MEVKAGRGGERQRGEQLLGGSAHQGGTTLGGGEYVLRTRKKEYVGGY